MGTSSTLQSQGNDAPPDQRDTRDPPPNKKLQTKKEKTTAQRETKLTSHSRQRKRKHKPIAVRGHLVIPDVSEEAMGNQTQTENEEEKTGSSTIDKVKVSKDLSSKQKQTLRTLLSEFEDVFKTQACAETRTDAPMHRIRLKPDSKPVCSTPYAYAPKVLEDLRKFLDKLLEEGMISPGEGPWAAPVVMVRKPCGSWRMCIDYRRLNELTVKDKFPLPRIQDLHHSLRGSSWFSSMDAMSGFYQIIMDPRDRAKTGRTS